MKVISLLTIVPMAVGLGACADDERVPGDEVAAQKPGGDVAAQKPGDDVAAQKLMVEVSEAHPDRVTIRDLDWAGSGCPAGTVASNLARDFTAFTLLFDSYVAEIGPGLPLSLGRKNCQILIDLDFPQGWSYSVFDVDYRGFVNVPRGVSGVQQSDYNFQGEFLTARLATALRGPRNGDYQIRDRLRLNAVVWSPCGAHDTLIINSSIRFVNESGNLNARGLMTTDSINGKVTHIYGLRWRRCTT
jgi:hypothetical protein